MGRMKELWQEMQDNAEPCASDYETRRSYNAKPKKKSKRAKKLKHPIRNTSEYSNTDRSVSMSINKPFDNAEEWLDDEPWRKW